MKTVADYLHASGFYYNSRSKSIIMITLERKAFYIMDNGCINEIFKPEDWEVQPMKDVQITGDVLVPQPIQFKF